MGWPFADWNLFLLIAARVLALIEVAPLLSGDEVPQAAKVGLAGFAASAVFPSVKAAGYPIPDDGAAYALLLLGEAMIGLIMGFFLNALYSAFQAAGQLFSLQIGFSAMETYDPLAQVELPLVGQFLNLAAMFVFLVSDGFNKLFLIGVQGSFHAMRAVDLVTRRDDIVDFLSKAVGALIQQSLVLAMPILGILFIMTIALGLLSKAAPQMNLLTEGYPITLTAAWLIMIATMPFMAEAFSRMIDGGFGDLARMLGGAK
ncbi:MAG TPA: flagellar biosynthetic protein FliR [Rectinemataceae bacterium]|nr:flagellar biosynthetic protein FliR [Rectinemataceae bacterium]